MAFSKVIRGRHSKVKTFLKIHFIPRESLVILKLGIKIVIFCENRKVSIKAQHYGVERNNAME